MGFAQAVRTCLGKYVTFSGRAGRPEYWWFILFVMLGVLVPSLIDGFVFGSEAGSLSPLTSLFQLLTFLPVLAAAWRRLHDSGKPGWYVLLPMAVSLVFSLAMLSGVTAFGVVEAEGVPADQLGGPSPGPGRLRPLLDHRARASGADDLVAHPPLRPRPQCLRPAPLRGGHLRPLPVRMESS
ncbi:MAG: DUF805 domain-containing protein [Geminicoccaceae bacterium]